MNIARLSIPSLILFTFSTAYAVPFSVETAVKQALDRNPEVQKFRERLVEDDANYHFASAKLFPTLTGLGTATYQKSASFSPSAVFGGDPYNQYGISINLNQPLYDGGALFAGFRFANKDRDIRQKDLEISERDTTVSVIQAFYGVILNQHLLEILQGDYEVQKEALKTAERFYKIGRNQKIDVLQQKTQTALIPPQIAQADDQLKTAAAQLAVLLRDIDTNDFQLKGKLVAPSMDWVKKTHASFAKEVPEITRSRLGIDQFGDTRSLQMAVNNPQLAVVGTLGRTTNARTDLLDSAYTYWAIGLQLNVPIFSGLSSIYQNKALASQQVQLEKDDINLADTTFASQVQSEKDLRVARIQLDSNREASEYGRESLKEAEKQYKLATISYIQYQTSQQAYLTAETGFYQSEYNYIIAIAKYYVATGTPVSALVAELQSLTNNPTAE